MLSQTRTILILGDSSDKKTQELDMTKDPNDNYYDPNVSYMLNFWNYYLAWTSLATHSFVMYTCLNCWCEWSKVAMLYSLQFVLLHMFCWAIPDRRYSTWVK